MKSKKKILIIVLMFCLGVVFPNITFDSDLNKTYNGYYFNSKDINMENQKTLSLDGKVYKTVLGFKKFEGEMTFDSKTIPVIIEKINSKKMNVYRKVGKDEGVGGLIPYGIVEFKDLKEDIAIGFYEKQEETYLFNPSDAMMFVSLENQTKEELLKVINKFK